MRGALAAIGRSIVAAIVLMAGGGAAFAYNVPGSNEAILAPVMRMAAIDNMSMIASCAENSGDLLSFGNDLNGSVNKAKAAVSAGSAYAAFDLRSNSAEFGSGISSADYDLILGSVCGARAFDVGEGVLLLGGAATFEDGSGTTLYNRGTVDHTGFGGALLLAWKPTPQTRFYASAGVAALDFDVSRSGGDVNGQFDATRWFAAIGVNHRIEMDSWFVSGNAGLQYVHFDADAYDETGFGYGISAPGSVPGYGFDMFLANAEGRVGYRFTNFEPYLLAGVSYDFDNGSALPGALGTLDFQEAGASVAYFGAGFEMPLGRTGSLGFEATSGYGEDEWRNLQVRGRIVLNF